MLRPRERLAAGDKDVLASHKDRRAGPCMGSLQVWFAHEHHVNATCIYRHTMGTTGWPGSLTRFCWSTPRLQNDEESRSGDLSSLREEYEGEVDRKEGEGDGVLKADAGPSGSALDMDAPEGLQKGGKSTRRFSAIHSNTRAPLDDAPALKVTLGTQSLPTKGVCSYRFSRMNRQMSRKLPCTSRWPLTSPSNHYEQRAGTLCVQRQKNLPSLQNWKNATVVHILGNFFSLRLGGQLRPRHRD